MFIIMFIIILHVMFIVMFVLKSPVSSAFRAFRLRMPFRGILLHIYNKLPRSAGNGHVHVSHIHLRMLGRFPHTTRKFFRQMDCCFAWLLLQKHRYLHILDQAGYSPPSFLHCLLSGKRHNTYCTLPYTLDKLEYILGKSYGSSSFTYCVILVRTVQLYPLFIKKM